MADNTKLPAGKRRWSEMLTPLLISLTTVVMGLVFGSVLILLIGKNPLEGYSKILFGALSNPRRIGTTLGYSTQLLLIGLSVAFAFKTGLFNIGGSGQMLLGGLAASLFAILGPQGLPRPVFYLCMTVLSLAAGAVWGLVAGFLKARFNVHEVVGTIMLNWVAYWLIYDAIYYLIADPNIIVKSVALAPAQTLRPEWMIKWTKFSFLNWGFVLAIAATAIVAFILNKTTLGFNLKAVGSNKYCAQYAGIRTNRSIIASMAISGALAGLAGLTFYAGFSNHMQVGILPPEGFDGIAVALLGNCAPLGVFFASIFFAILKMGKGSLTATGIPTEIADTIIAIIIYFTATASLVGNFWARTFKRRAEYLAGPLEYKKARFQALEDAKETACHVQEAVLAKKLRAKEAALRARDPQAAGRAEARNGERERRLAARNSEALSRMRASHTAALERLEARAAMKEGGR